MGNKFFTIDGNKNFTYNNETEKDLVQALVELGKQKLYAVHKSNGNIGSSIGSHVIIGRNRMFSGIDTEFDYETNNKIAIDSLLKYAAESAGVSMDSLKSPRVRRDPVFSSKFFSVISQALPPIITATVNYMFMEVADVRNIGWGDTQHFKVASKDIFTVNRIGKGIKRGTVQRIYSEDITVNPEGHEITVGMDWYQMVSGRYDIGEWLYRVGLSFTTDITTRVYNQINDSFATLPTPLQIAGYTESDFVLLAQRVKAANGNIPVSCMGTMTALASVLPHNDYLKMELGAEYASVGYLGRFKGVDLMEIPQVLVPGTVNTTLDLAVAFDRLYFFSLDSDKPVKLVFEGEAITKEEDSISSADGQMIISIQNMYEAKVASASVYGIMEV